MYFLNISFQIRFQDPVVFLVQLQEAGCSTRCTKGPLFTPGSGRIIGPVHVQHVQEGSGVRLPGDTSPELHCLTPRPGSNFWAATHTIQMFLQRLACAACDTTLFRPHWCNPECLSIQKGEGMKSAKGGGG